MTPPTAVTSLQDSLIECLTAEVRCPEPRLRELATDLGDAARRAHLPSADALATFRQALGLRPDGAVDRGVGKMRLNADEATLVGLLDCAIGAFYGHKHQLMSSRQFAR